MHIEMILYASNAKMLSPKYNNIDN